MAVPTQMNALFIINQIVNGVFVIDICLQFFIPVPDIRPENEGELIHDHKLIAKRYFKGWFLLDVISVLPFDALTVANPDLMQPGPMTKVFRLIRIMRLIKLMRVLRASRIIQRWENSISISYSARSLNGAMIGILVLLHWLTCAPSRRAAAPQSIARKKRYTMRCCHHAARVQTEMGPPPPPPHRLVRSPSLALFAQVLLGAAAAAAGRLAQRDGLARRRRRLRGRPNSMHLSGVGQPRPAALPRVQRLHRRRPVDGAHLRFPLPDAVRARGVGAHHGGDGDLYQGQ